MAWLLRWRDRNIGRRRDLYLAAAILLLATVLRAGWPTLTEFKFSEARLEALTLELTREGRVPLVGVPSSAGFDHSPISVYLYTPAFLFTTNPIPATIYGALIGAAAVALCWWLARLWPGGGRHAAWISALLFAVSPWAVAFSRKIWQVVFVPFLALVFIALAVSALVERPGASSAERGKWSLSWALMIFALLVQVHPSAISCAPALALWMILFRRRLRLGPLLLGAALAGITGLPFIVHQMQSGWPALAALRTLPDAVWDLSSLRLTWEAITGRGIHALSGDAYPLLRIVPQLGWFFNLIGWLAIASALWAGWRMITRWRAQDARQRQTAQVDLVLLSWLVAPVLYNLRHSLDLYLHFFAVVIPAAYLLIGRAAQETLGRPHPSRLGIAAAAALGILATAQVVSLAQMGRFVATHDTPGGFGTSLGRYLAIANQAIARATERGAAEVLVVGQGDSVVVDEIPAIFDVLLRGRVRYRFVDGGSTALFPSHPALAILAPGAGEAATWYRSLPTSVVVVDNGYVQVDLDGSWPQAQFQPVPGLRLFENGVEAQGYAWESENAPDESLRFWLLWQVLWLDPRDTHFFAHVVDEAGTVWGQRDSAGYPTPYRQKGDRIASKFDITKDVGVPPAPYSVRVGQYLYPQIVNLPLIDGNGKPAADAVVLGPWGGDPK